MKEMVERREVKWDLMLRDQNSELLAPFRVVPLSG